MKKKNGQRIVKEFKNYSQKIAIPGNEYDY